MRRQCLIQLLTSPHNSNRDGSCWNIEICGHFLVGVAVHHAASKDTFIVVLQIGHGVFEGLHELGFFQGSAVGVREDLVEDVEAVIRIHEVKACHWPGDATFRTQRGEGLIASDFKDPGPKAGADLVEVALEEDFHESLLGNVLCQPFVSDDASDELTHLSPIPSLDDRKAFFDVLSLVDQGHQLIVGELIAGEGGLCSG